MLDLSTLTHERMAACLGHAFVIDLGAAGVLQTRLVEVPVAGPRGLVPEPDSGGRRQAFSAVFRGPPAPVLPQGIHRLTHADLGALDLFLVPVGRDATGVLYEAAFN